MGHRGQLRVQHFLVETNRSFRSAMEVDSYDGLDEQDEFLQNDPMLVETPPTPILQILRKRKNGPRMKVEAELRLEKDLAEIREKRNSGEPCCFRLYFPVKNHILDFIATFNISEGPYSGTRISFNVKVPSATPSRYPYTPPSFTCQQSVFHPNIDPENGETLCLSITTDWTPVLSMDNILLAIELLFHEPHIDNNVILNPKAAHLYMNNRLQYNKTLSEAICGNFVCGKSWDKILVSEQKRKRDMDFDDLDENFDNRCAKKCKLSQAFQQLKLDLQQQQQQQHQKSTISSSTPSINTNINNEQPFYQSMYTQNNKNSSSSTSSENNHNGTNNNSLQQNNTLTMHTISTISSPDNNMTTPISRRSNPLLNRSSESRKRSWMDTQNVPIKRRWIQFSNENENNKSGIHHEPQMQPYQQQQSLQQIQLPQQQHQMQQQQHSNPINNDNNNNNHNFNPNFKFNLNLTSIPLQNKETDLDDL